MTAERPSWTRIILKTPVDIAFALALEGNPPMLRRLLQCLDLPEGADRIAFAAGKEPDSACTLVSREGQVLGFLAEGEEKEGIPVVTWEGLQALKDKDPEPRAWLGRAWEYEESGGLLRLLEPVLTAGDALSREEFVKIAFYQPLLEKQIFALQINAGTRLEEGREWFKSNPSQGAAYQYALQAYYGILFSIGHLAILSSLRGCRPWMLEIMEKIGDDTGAYSWGAVRQGVSSVALRALYAVGQMGPKILPFYLRASQNAATPLQAFSAVSGLLMLGLRYPELGEMIRDYITRHPVRDSSGNLTVGGAFLDLAETLSEYPEEVRKESLLSGRALAVKMTQWLPGKSPYKFRRPEEVPDEVALAFLVDAEGDHMNRGKDKVELLSLLPLLAKARPEDLYLPARLLRLVKKPWRPEQTLALLARFEDFSQQKPAAGRTEKVSRNQPCPCGSGKKYKKCCGLN